MKLYAEVGPRRSRQLLADVVVLGWCALWVVLGVVVHSSFDGAEKGAANIGSSGSSLSSNLSDAGNFVSVLPFGGSKLKDSFDSAAGAAQSMSTAGHDMSDGLGRLAFLLGFLTAVAPMFFALLPWAIMRGRYARRAGRVARLRRLPGAEKLLALEALTHASPDTLANIDDDPAGRWQHGDAAVTRRLASIALSTYGLRDASPATKPAASASVSAVGADDSQLVAGKEASSARAVPAASKKKAKPSRSAEHSAPWAAGKSTQEPGKKRREHGEQPNAGVTRGQEFDDDDTHWA